MRSDLSVVCDMSLWVAGVAGQAGLAASADGAWLRAAVDQHEAEVRACLGGRPTVGTVLSYARGFVDAAVARGWWPRHHERASAESLALAPDWESLRLAAVCRLYLEAEGLAP